MPFDGLRRAFAVMGAALAQEKAAPKQHSRGRDETEFLPAALELLETPPSPTARLFFWFMTAFLAIALAWSFIGQLDVVATAEGKLVPAGKVKLIQPLEAGIVRAIHVQDGATVRAGDLLVELDATATGADFRRLTADLVAAEAEAARLRAAQYPLDALAHYKPGAVVPAEQRVMQQALLLNQTEEYRAKLAALEEEVTRRKAERRSVDTAIEKVQAAMPLLRQRRDARQELADKGYGSRLVALELQQQVIEQEHELQALRHRREESNAALGGLEKQKRQYEAEYHKAILAQLAETERKIATLTEELLKAEQRQDQQRLLAPVDGVVQQLAVHTVGGVVTPAQALMVIVPADMPLEIEAVLPNRDIGFIHPGQSAEVKLETYLFTKYGTQPAQVVSVSRDAVQDEKRGLIYPVRMALERTWIEVDGRRMNLAAGMALVAEVKTDQRRVIDYLLSPILRYQQESLRER
ncbi:HlyD family type I secretion periplasmic adaptor subunit [Ferrovibrio sp. MS7]|uniref:HlyD family type I secretion periplasmic adaptor subunit n=1 Tax=Ferrovibrio plantarum TaxID=3119164 RepID=UPI0031375EC8